MARLGAAALPFRRTRRIAAADVLAERGGRAPPAAASGGEQWMLGRRARAPLHRLSISTDEYATPHCPMLEPPASPPLPRGIPALPARWLSAMATPVGTMPRRSRHSGSVSQWRGASAVDCARPSLTVPWLRGHRCLTIVRGQLALTSRLTRCLSQQFNVQAVDETQSAAHHDVWPHTTWTARARGVRAQQRGHEVRGVSEGRHTTPHDSRSSSVTSTTGTMTARMNRPSKSRCELADVSAAAALDCRLHWPFVQRISPSTTATPCTRWRMTAYDGVLPSAHRSSGSVSTCRRLTAPRQRVATSAAWAAPTTPTPPALYVYLLGGNQASGERACSDSRAASVHLRVRDTPNDGYRHQRCMIAAPR